MELNLKKTNLDNDDDDDDNKTTIKRKANFLTKKTSSVYDCTVEDVEYICNSNSTLCLFFFLQLT